MLLFSILLPHASCFSNPRERTKLKFINNTHKPFYSPSEMEGARERLKCQLFSMAAVATLHSSVDKGNVRIRQSVFFPELSPVQTFLLLLLRPMGCSRATEAESKGAAPSKRQEETLKPALSVALPFLASAPSENARERWWHSEQSSTFSPGNPDQQSIQ